MIDGVNVLSKAEITECSAWFYVVLCIYALLLACCFMAFVKYSGEKISDIATAIGIASSFVIMLLVATNESFFEEPTGGYEYKVTIDESVNFVEFNNRYEIIDQEGLIYTIVDREVNND